MAFASPSRSLLSPHDGRLSAHLMGTVDFDALLALQEQHIYECSGREDRDGVLFLCEHPPLLSMGRTASLLDVAVEPEELARREIPVRWVARGGGAVMHAPGQLAIILQVPLARLNLGLTDFRALFEQAVLACCRELKIPAKRDASFPGVWSRGGQVAAFGAGVKSWVTCHGMYLNVAVDPQDLQLTRCPVPGARMTSLQSQRLDPIRMAPLRTCLIEQLAAHFGYREVDLATGHPQLRRVLRPAPIRAS